MEEPVESISGLSIFEEGTRVVLTCSKCEVLTVHVKQKDGSWECTKCETPNNAT